MARALSSLIAFALLFAAASASTTTEHDHAHTTDQEPGSTTTGGPVSAAWAPRGLSLWAVLAFLVMLIADPVAAIRSDCQKGPYITEGGPRGNWDPKLESLWPEGPKTLGFWPFGPQAPPQIWDPDSLGAPSVRAPFGRFRANTTTEHDHAHTTDQEPASTTTGVVSGAPPGAASVGAVALVGAVAAWASL